MKEKIFFLITFTLLLSGCVTQESPDIAVDYERSISEQEAIEACSKTNLSNNILVHQNVVHTFQCLRWHKNFQNLFETISKFDSSKWDHLFTKINTFFINDQDTKNRVLKSYKRLDDHNSLDFLQRTYDILNDSNLYVRARELFNCAEDSSRDECERLNHSISKEEILNFLLSLNTNQNQLKKLLHIVHTNYQNFLRYRDRIEPLSRDLIKTPGFDDLRIEVMDLLTNKFIEGIDSKDITFIQYLLTTKDEVSNRPYLYELFQNEDFTLDEFMRVITYPINENPTYFQDLRILSSYYEKGITCKAFNEDGDLIYIDLGKSVGTFLKNSNHLNYFEFLQKSFDLTVQLKNSYEFCPDIFDLNGETLFFEDGKFVKQEHSVHLLNFNDSFNRYLQDEDKYNLFKLLTYVGIQAKEIKDPLYTIRIGAHDLMLAGNEINRFIYQNVPEMFPLGFEMSKEMTEKDYAISSSFLMNTINDPLNIDTIKTISKFWQNLESEDKKAVLAIMDAQLEDGNDLGAIMLYSVESLSEVVEVSNDLLPLLFSKENVNKTYESLKALTLSFSNKDLTDDLKNFFSKDHLLGIYKILIAGLPYSGPIKDIIGRLIEFKKSLEELLLDGVKLTRLAYELIFKNPDPEKASEYYKCMADLSKTGMSFYELIHALPDSCDPFKKQSMGFRYLDYLNIIADNFSLWSQTEDWPGPPLRWEEKTGLFDRKGIFSPDLINSSVANMKLVDEILGPSENGGIAYALEVLGNHLFNWKIKENLLIDPIKRSIELFDGLLQSGQESKIWRNYLLRKALQEEHFNHIPELTKNTGGFFLGLSEEINNGKYDEYYNKVFPAQDPRLRCESFHNLNIENNPCPDKETLKDLTEKIVKGMLVSKGPEGWRPIDLNIQGLHPDGINLPLPYPKGVKPQHYVFDLKEQVLTYYDLADKSLPINKQLFPYFPKNYDKKFGGYKKQLKEWKKGNLNKVDPQYMQQLTTSERIETIMRQFSFDDYNLLVQVANHSAFHRMDNVKLTLEKNELLKGCINLGACGLTLNREEKRMANNALTMYDAFIEIHTFFNHAENLQVFTAATVISSAPDVRKPWAAKLPTGELPILFTRKQLKGHNASLLTLTAKLAVVSNLGRWMKDRLGRTRNELQKYLKSEEFKILNANYMRGYPLRGTYYALSSILEEITKNQSGDQSFLDDMIDYLYDRDYQEIRLIENFIGNLLFINSFIGPASEKIGLEHFINEKTDQLYSENKDFNVLIVAPLLIKKWSVLKNHWPREMNLLDLIKKVNTFMSLFKDRLLKKDIYAYRALNDSFMLINQIFLKNQKDSKKGLEILLEYLVKDDNLYKVAQLVDTFLDYIETLTLQDGVRTGERAEELGNNLLKLGEERRMDYNALRLYLERTLQAEFCQDSHCRQNPHYDELSTLIHYLNQENSQGIKYLEVFLETIAIKEREDLVEMLQEFLPNLEIKK